jgi:hypothetical protein
MRFLQILIISSLTFSRISAQTIDDTSLCNYSLASQNKYKAFYYREHSEGAISIIFYQDKTFEYENIILGHKVNFSTGTWYLEDSAYILKYNKNYFSRLFLKRKRTYSLNECNFLNITGVRISICPLTKIGKRPLG